MTTEADGQNLIFKNEILNARQDGLTEMRFKDGDKISVDIVAESPCLVKP